jgi:hypothetical protein
MASINVQEFKTEAEMNPLKVADYGLFYSHELIAAINAFDLKKSVHAGRGLPTLISQQHVERHLAAPRHRMCGGASL